MKSHGKFGASELRSHIGYWMRVVSNHVPHSFAKKLESSGVTVAADQNDEIFSPLSSAERMRLKKILKKLAEIHELSKTPIR